MQLTSRRMRRCHTHQPDGSNPPSSRIDHFGRRKMFGVGRGVRQRDVCGSRLLEPTRSGAPGRYWLALPGIVGGRTQWPLMHLGSLPAGEWSSTPSIVAISTPLPNSWQRAAYGCHLQAPSGTRRDEIIAAVKSAQTAGWSGHRVLGLITGGEFVVGVYRNDYADGSSRRRGCGLANRRERQSERAAFTRAARRGCCDAGVTRNQQ